MTERLTDEELVEANNDLDATCNNIMYRVQCRRDLFKKLLAAAEECDSLLAAIAEHRDSTAYSNAAANDIALWKTLA